MARKISPVGFMIFIKPDFQAEVDFNGAKFQIVVDDRRGVAACDQGRVVAVGPTAWKAYDNGEPWAKVGDHVGYAKYAGRIVEHPDTKEKFVMVADGDVRYVIEESQDD